MKCEKCSMVATMRSMDESGVMHFYCDHHAPAGATPLGARPSLWNTYRPLIIAFGVIIAVTIITSIWAVSYNGATLMQWFMGYFFLVFGGMKVITWKKFALSFGGYDPLAKFFKPYVWIYPALEIILAVAFLAGYEIMIASWVTIVILGITTIGIIRAIRNHEDLQCVCLGGAFSLPLGWVTVAENVLMIAMAIGMIVAA